MVPAARLETAGPVILLSTLAAGVPVAIGSGWLSRIALHLAAETANAVHLPSEIPSVTRYNKVDHLM